MEDIYKMLQDIIDSFWTGVGSEVQAGPNIEEFSMVDNSDRKFNWDLITAFRKIYSHTPGYKSANFLTSTITPDSCELELSVVTTHRWSMGDIYQPNTLLEELYQGPILIRVGAEFKAIDKEAGRYNLKLFLKSFEGNRLVFDTGNLPKKRETIGNYFAFVYELLEKRGYIAPETTVKENASTPI